MNRKSGLQGFFTLSMIFLCIGIFNSTGSFAQKFYGNDWIDYNGREYYKIKISNDGFYRVDFNALNSAGLSGKNPDETHLWFRGQQVPVSIKHNGDNKFDSDEYIEFYGQRNDGTLDSVLYPNPAQQPHRNFSFYKDTSVYFLTWSAAEPKVRLKEHPANISTAIAPISYFVDEKALYLTEEFNKDLPFIPQQGYSSAEYREGEGYLSKKILLGAKREFLLTTQGLVNNGVKPEIEFLIFGESDYNGTADDHRLLVQIRSGSGSFRTLLDTTYNGFKRIYKKLPLDYSDIGAQTYVKVSSEGINGTTADVHAVSYIKLRYPRDLNFSGYNQLNFTFNNQNSDSINHFKYSGFNLPSSQNLFLYDKTNGLRTKSFSQGSDFHFTTPNLGNADYFLFSENEISSVVIGEKIIFPRLDYNAGYNYLIVTNKKILNAAQEFATYKASTKIDSVNNFKPFIVTVDQLYDQFFYGIYHPAAIQRFCAYMYNNSTQKPQYLLLAGKGYDPVYLKSIKNYDNDLVPVIGSPTSDLLFTAGMDIDFKGPDATIDPLIGIGRISAKDENELRTYLNKLKDFENAPKHPWQKHVMHINAGDKDNFTTIKNSMNTASNIITSPYVGASLWKFDNTASEQINSTAIERIQNEINSGASIFTFFGHGSATQLGVDLGRPDEYLQDISSTGKFPFFYINGCNSGVIESSGRTTGEDWIFEKNKGAIGWLAHSSTGYTVSIGLQIQKFYNNLTSTYYGETVGQLWRQTMRDLDKDAVNSKNDLYRNTALTLILQGDPSVRLHFLPKPDLAVFDTALSVFPEDAIASSDSVAIRINAYNLGKVTLDSFEVKVQRTFPNGQSFTYDTKKFPPLYNRRTIDFWMKTSTSFKSQGLNKVEITIDPLNKIAEDDELNNTARLTFDLPGNGVRQLFPVEFGISPVDTPELIVQSRNLFDSKTGVYYEIDTNLTFSSPWVKRSPLIPATHIMKWKPKLLAKDSVVYYWRARLDVDSGFAGEWERSSFIYIKNSPEGWSQSHWQQFSTITPDDIIIDTTNKEFLFHSRFSTLSFIGHYRVSPGRGIISDVGNENLNPRVCITSTLFFIEFDKNTLAPVSRYKTCAGYNYYYRQFNMRLATTKINPSLPNELGRDSFVHYINNIPEGNYVALLTKPGQPDQQFYNYDAATLAAFDKIGGSKIRNAAAMRKDSVVYALLGRKGSTQGETIADSLLPFIDDSLVLYFKAQMQGRLNSGSYTSRIIGPAKKWKSFYYEYNPIELPNNDEANFSIYGIDNLEQASLLYDSVTKYGFDLSKIDAKDYPRLQITANVKDTTHRTPPQLKIWQVLYEGVPEGTLIVDKDYLFKADTIAQGEDSVRIRLKYRNISRFAMDSVLVRVSMEDVANKSELVTNKFYPPLAPDNEFVISFATPTTKLKPGLHRLSVFVNPDFQQPELTLDNNLLRLPVYIKGDNINPVMDVTFDGRHIMDGELVSAKPTILITSKDENRNRILNDTSLFKIVLKRQNDTKSDTIRFNSGQLTFRPGTEANNKASVEFRPKDLEDGVHELTVQAYDASGNRAGEDDYKITFEVINKSMVSNFFVYPNPFTTRAKFVFTLTGSEVPAYMKVQIMTITGKVVKEITREDLGDLHVGHNITNYTWDGTDEYGDMLANGLYMYRVVVKNNDNKQVDAYQTSADKFFDKNFGKLYIMR